MQNQFQGTYTNIKLNIKGKEMKNIMPVLTLIGAKLEKQIPSPMLTKDYCKSMIVLQRLVAQNSIDAYNDSRTELRAKQRQETKLKEDNITFLPLKVMINDCKKKAETYHTHLMNCGDALVLWLDSWQKYGATRPDLYNLCCCSQTTIDSVEKSLEDNNEQDISFSHLIWVYNLDFDKHTCDWLDMEYPAPLTHSIKEFMSDQVIKAMKDNPSLKKQMNEKLFELFPAVEKSALYENRDAEGNKVLTTKDGEIVSVLEEAIPLSEDISNALCHILGIVLNEKTEDEHYIQLKKGFDNLCEILEQRGLQDIEEYISSINACELDEFLELICPRLISQNDILQIFENQLKHK